MVDHPVDFIVSQQFMCQTLEHRLPGGLTKRKYELWCKTLDFTWDPDKSATNVRKHGIAFEDAKRIFDGPTVEREDDRIHYGEIRVYAIGLLNGVEITVIYTDPDDDTRHIIPAWRAEPHERRYFWQYLAN